MGARGVPGRQPMASFALHASRKWPRTGESPIRGKIRAPCIQNELALARCARHVSEKPRKSPSEDTPREDLARKGPFSLHGPLESCTARRSCYPASANHPRARNLCAAEQCEPPAITAPPSWRGSPRNMPPGTAPNRPSARNPGGCPRRKRSPPHARISSSLRRGFALFRRKRAPTIHIYPPLLWRGFPADAPRTAAFPCHPGECRSAPCACHGVPDRNRLPSAPRQCGKRGNL